MTRERRAPRGGLRKCLIADDRDRNVELLDPIRLYLSGSHDVIERPVLERIVDAGMTGGSTKLRLSMLFAAALFVAMALFAFVPEYRATGDLRHSLVEAALSPVIYFALGYGILIVPWQIRAERRIRRRLISAALLRHRRCAHCGYSLEGLDPDEADGATTCPECACAWRLDEASLTARAGDEREAARELVRFSILIGVLMTAAGLVMGAIYVFF